MVTIKVYDNLRSCRTLFFVELEYPDHNPQTILELVEQFSIKRTICVFPLNQENVGKEAKFVGKG